MYPTLRGGKNRPFSSVAATARGLNSARSKSITLAPGTASPDGRRTRPLEQRIGPDRQAARPPEDGEKAHGPFDGFSIHSATPCLAPPRRRPEDQSVESRRTKSRVQSSPVVTRSSTLEPSRLAR